MTRNGFRKVGRLPGPDVTARYGQVQQVAAAHPADLAPAAAAHLGPPDTEAVDRDELLRRARAGQVTVLDVRPAEEHAAGPTPGAISIPLADLSLTTSAPSGAATEPGSGQDVA